MLLWIIEQFNFPALGKSVWLWAHKHDEINKWACRSCWKARQCRKVNKHSCKIKVWTFWRFVNSISLRLPRQVSPTSRLLTSPWKPWGNGWRRTRTRWGLFSSVMINYASGPAAKCRRIVLFPFYHTCLVWPIRYAYPIKRQFDSNQDFKWSGGFANWPVFQTLWQGRTQKRMRTT